MEERPVRISRNENLRSKTRAKGMEEGSLEF